MIISVQARKHLCCDIWVTVFWLNVINSPSSQSCQKTVNNRKRGTQNQHHAWTEQLTYLPPSVCLHIWTENCGWRSRCNLTSFANTHPDWVIWIILIFVLSGTYKLNYTHKFGNPFTIFTMDSVHLFYLTLVLVQRQHSLRRLSKNTTVFCWVEVSEMSRNIHLIQKGQEPVVKTLINLNWLLLLQKDATLTNHLNLLNCSFDSFEHSLRQLFHTCADACSYFAIPLAPRWGGVQKLWLVNMWHRYGGWGVVGSLRWLQVFSYSSLCALHS